MQRKACVVGAFCFLLAFALPLQAAEFWRDFANPASSDGNYPEITFCRHLSPTNVPGETRLVTHSQASDFGATPGPIYDFSTGGPAGRLLGGGIGAGGLWGPLPPDASGQPGLDSGIGPRVLFPGGVGWVDPNARGTVRIWAGPTYSDATLFAIDDSEFGFGEGVIAGYRLTRSLGLYGSLSALHYEEMTIFLGTVGVQRFGNPRGPGLIDRISVWIFWDNYTDTLDGNLTDFQQLRFNIGVVGPVGNEVGFAFSVSLDEPPDYFLTPLGGVHLLSSGESVVGPYMRFPISIFDISAMLGYSTRTETGVLGLGARARITESLAVFADGKVGAANGGDTPYTLLAGAELLGGLADTIRF